MNNPDVPATSSVMNAEKHREEKYKKENKFDPNQGLGDIDHSETATISKKSNDPCEKKEMTPLLPSEIDIFLHKFIRHEPPSKVNHTSQSNLGSLEKKISPDYESLASKLGDLLIAARNMTSAFNENYSSPSAPIGGMLPVRPTEGLPQYQYMNSNMMVPQYQYMNSNMMVPQYQYMNSNMMVPSFTGHILPGPYQQQLQQAQLQHFHQTLALNNAQLQHTQLSTGIVNTDRNTRNEQVINQSQVQNSKNLPAQSPQVKVPQQSVTSMETPSSKREDLSKQHTVPDGRSQNSGKTSEELQLEYQNAILALRREQEEMQKSQVQTSVPGAQAQPSWGVVVPTMPMAVHPLIPIGMVPHPLIPIGMVPQVNPYLIQQWQNTGVMAPNVNHGSPNLPAAAAAVNMDPVINLNSEINTAEEPAPKKSSKK